jgi:hypothetical protein
MPKLTPSQEALLARIKEQCENTLEKCFTPGESRREMKALLRLEREGLVRIERGELRVNRSYKLRNWGRDYSAVDRYYLPMSVFVMVK